MIVNKKEFNIGIALFALFVIIFCCMWTPSFDNLNAFNYADRLFNRLSKDSCYQVPDLITKAEEQRGIKLSTSFKAEDAEQAQTIAAMFNKVGAQAQAEADKVSISGDFGEITTAILRDCDAAFANKGEVFQNEYRLDAKAAMYNWWFALDQIYNKLQESKNFEQAKLINDFKVKGVEPGYNYFGIQGKAVSEASGRLAFLLLFYVAYTMVLGFSIFFIFEGIGIMAAGKKKAG